MAALFLNNIISKWIVDVPVIKTNISLFESLLQSQPAPRTAAAGSNDWVPKPVDVASKARPKQPLTLQETLLAAGGSQPSIWTFVTSGYAIVLLIVALLCNRIYNVVPPRRRNFRLEPVMRIALRLPALVLLSRAIILVLSKYAYDSPIDEFIPGLFRVVLPEDYGVRDDSSVMWSVFLSLGIACLVEAFVRALNQDVRAHPSVNLLSVSYLLHFHSTPASSPILKPTPLVYLLIALTLSEVLSLQLMDTFELNIRLLLTGVFSIFGQGAMLALLIRATNQERDPIAMSALLPALRHLTRLSELLFFCISAMTISLHALAQLVVEGRITREIFGPAARLPSMSDDFSIAVMLYGTACLENTYLTGFSNEVSPINIPKDPWIDLGRGLNQTAHSDSISASAEGPVTLRQPLKASHSYGFNNEIKDVRPSLIIQQDGEVPDFMSRSSGVLREALRFLWFVVLIAWRIFQISGRLVGSRIPVLRRRAARPGWLSATLRFFGVRPAVSTEHRLRALITPLNEDDSADEDFIPGQETHLDDPSEESDSDIDSQDYDEPSSRSRSTSVQPTELYSDILQTSTEISQAEEQDLNNILLSHMVSPSLLTRRKYQQLTRSPLRALVPLTGGSGEIIDRRHTATPEQIETQLVCVVCRSEVRSIICWPCRCLSLCDVCKDTLAAHPSSANVCVTCRKPVKGYSKLFIP